MAKSKNNSSKKQRRKSRKKRIKVDARSLAEPMIDDVINALGIDYLDLSEKEKKEIAFTIVEELTSSISYRPSKRALLSRISRLKIRLAPLVAEKLLEKRKTLSEEILDYVINYGGPVAAAYVRRLYAKAKEYGRDDLISILRSIWETYGRPLPIKCPYCGFASIQPNFTCFVCGKKVSVSELKEAIDFEALLEMFVDVATLDDIKRIEENQALIYDPRKGLKTRKDSPDRVQYIIPLSEKEVKEITEKIEDKFKPKPEIEEKIEEVIKVFKEGAKKIEEKREVKTTLDMFLKKEEK